MLKHVSSSYQLFLSESQQLFGTSTMLDRRLLSSTITTSCSPFTYTQEASTDLAVGDFSTKNLADQ
jgi:hypothetical protein